jgi:Flp pilus assembly protein CpaB
VSLSEFTARLSGWPRRVLALAFLLFAVVAALGARHRTGDAGPTTSVLVATSDLAAGVPLSGADVRVRAWPAGIRPPEAPSHPAQVIGRRLAGPIRAGEPITASRLTGADLTAGLPAGLQAVPVEITGAASLNLVRVGDSIDLLVSDPPQADLAPVRPARVLAQRVRVLAVSGPLTDPGVDNLGSGSVGLVVAADRMTALRIAAATGRQVVATVRGPP